MWNQCREICEERFSSKNVTARKPGEPEKIQAYLWCRTVPCPKCGLKIPLSTNFSIVKKKGRPQDDLAVFPVVHAAGDTCAFRFVKPSEYAVCRWPRLAPGEHFHPTETPTFFT